MRKLFLLLVSAVLLFGAMGATASAAEPCVPRDAETTGWVLTDQVPPGDGWYLSDTRTVVDEEGYVIPGTPSQHYSYKGGPIEGTPLPPSEDPDAWQANTEQEPHYAGNATPAQKPDGSPYVDGDSGLHYTSHGNAGLADWFYFDPGTPDEVVDAVTHTEYMYARDAVKCDTPPRGGPEKPERTKAPDVELAFTGPSAFTVVFLTTLSILCAAIGTGLYLKGRRY